VILSPTAFVLVTGQLETVSSDVGQMFPMAGPLKRRQGMTTQSLLQKLGNKQETGRCQNNKSVSKQQEFVVNSASVLLQKHI